jgi:phospholipid transport system substrate-binding protein
MARFDWVSGGLMVKTFAATLIGASLGALFALAPLSPAVAATSNDPAAATVESFDDALVGIMKAGAAAGAKGRAHSLTPAVESSFDLPTMTRFAVGPTWAGLTEAQHAALISAFTRYTVANWASNFDSYSGQKFEIAAVQMRGTEKIVQCQLVSPHGAPVSLIYRLHEGPGGWKIIDIYFNGISQLTTRRADFAGPLASGGAAGLISHLDALTHKLES